MRPASGRRKVVFKKRGRYSCLCTVPGHTALGTKGVLAVGTTAPRPTTTAKTTTTTATATGPFLEPGKSATMTVNLQAGKSYSYLCDVPGHAELGMRGTFTPSSG